MTASFHTRCGTPTVAGTVKSLSYPGYVHGAVKAPQQQNGGHNADSGERRSGAGFGSKETAWAAPRCQMERGAVCSGRGSISTTAAPGAAPAGKAAEVKSLPMKW
jgi:hypothetical protein